MFSHLIILLNVEKNFNKMRKLDNKIKGYFIKQRSLQVRSVLEEVLYVKDI